MYVPTGHRNQAYSKPTVSLSTWSFRKFVKWAFALVSLLAVFILMLLQLRHQFSDLHLETDSDAELVVINQEIANKYGALCLDGVSLPSYYFKQGINEGENKWLVVINNSSLCYSDRDCFIRQGASVTPLTLDLTELLVVDLLYFSYFSSWNIVVILPCDGASLLGNSTITYSGKTLPSKGASIMYSTLKHLQSTTEISKAEHLVLYGRDFGAVAAMLYSSFIMQQLKYAHRFTLIADSGLLFNSLNLQLFYQLHEIDGNGLINCKSVDCFDAYHLVGRQLPPTILLLSDEPIWSLNTLYGCQSFPNCSYNGSIQTYKSVLKKFLHKLYEDQLHIQSIVMSCDRSAGTSRGARNDSKHALSSIIVNAINNPYNRSSIYISHCT